MRHITSCLVGAFGLTLVAVVPASAQTTIYACVLNSQGQIRLVSGRGQCRSGETEAQWQSGADLSAITSAVDAVRNRVDGVEQAVRGLPAIQSAISELAVLPPVVPLSVADATGQGSLVGCELVGEGSSERRFGVRCPPGADVTAPHSGTALFLTDGPDMAYTYDGLYLCGLASPGLRERGATFTVYMYFHELEIAADGERTLRRRDSSFNSARRGVRFIVPATALAPIELDAASAGKRPCVTLRFAEGVQDGDQPRLPNDIWIPSTELMLYMPMPAMLPIAISNPDFDYLYLSQVGLTVAGRRPAAP